MRGVVEAPFGHVSVSVDDAGRVVDVSLSDQLARSSASEGFPGSVIEAFEAYVQGRAEAVRVSVGRVDVSGFRRKVCEALSSIPFGSVATYGGLARRVGCPGGARAVGQALGSNPLPLVWPCHRVVASRGLGGFMGGRDALGVKRWLLEHEGALDAVVSR